MCHNLVVMTSRDLSADVLSRTLAALADPTRRSILEQLSLGPASVSGLAKPYAMSQPAVSKHIKVLEASGLVSQEPGSRLGPRRLELAPFLTAAQWMEAYARIWASRLRNVSRESGRNARAARRTK